MSRRSPGPAPRSPALVTPSCGTGVGRCELGDAMRLASKAHVLDALHLLGARPMRFNELRASLRVGANVLSLRLKDLVDAGLVARRALPGATEYSATPMGRDLLAALAPLREWAARHAPPPVPARESLSATG